MEVVWNMDEGGKWYSFLRTDLKHERFEHAAGVYIIWHEGKNRRTVRVGHGDIRRWIGLHRHNEKIIAQSVHGRLKVTWAEIPRSSWDGVEKYLEEKLEPLVQPKRPDVKPIRVNLPW